MYVKIPLNVVNTLKCELNSEIDINTKAIDNSNLPIETYKVKGEIRYGVSIQNIDRIRAKEIRVREFKRILKQLDTMTANGIELRVEDIEYLKYEFDYNKLRYLEYGKELVKKYEKGDHNIDDNLFEILLTKQKRLSASVKALENVILDNIHLFDCYPTQNRPYSHKYSKDSFRKNIALIWLAIVVLIGIAMLIYYIRLIFYNHTF